VKILENLGNFAQNDNDNNDFFLCGNNDFSNIGEAMQYLLRIVFEIYGTIDL
jgi:hypothetical protein